MAEERVGIPTSAVFVFLQHFPQRLHARLIAGGNVLHDAAATLVSWFQNLDGAAGCETSLQSGLYSIR